MRAMRCLLFLPLLVSLSSATGLCPDHWLLFRDTCLGVFPVWASWSSAETLCSQSASHLVSLHSKNDLEFLHKTVAELAVPVWTGGYSVSQSDLWFWSDGSDFNPEIWANLTAGNRKPDEACLGLTKEDGEVKSAPCGELRFYICSRTISWSSYDSNEPAAVSSGLTPGVSLFSLLWGKSETVADEILRSSSFLRQLTSGNVTQRCYDLFRQQEALYTGLVYRTLEALAFDTREADPGVKSLLLDTKDFYSKSSKQRLVAAPQWLHFALQSFHSVVADDPVYLLVALSARPVLNSFVLRSVPLPGPGVSSPESRSLFLNWREESERDVEFAQRFSEVFERLQNDMDVFKSIDVFRVHMMNQKSLHKHVFSEVFERLQNDMDVFKSIDVFRVHMMNQKSLHKHVECQQ